FREKWRAKAEEPKPRLRDRLQPFQPRCCRAGPRVHCTARRELQIGFASRSGMERPAAEGDSPVSESDPTPGRVPEYHVEGLSCGNPSGPPSQDKYSRRPMWSTYRMEQ